MMELSLDVEKEIKEFEKRQRLRKKIERLEGIESKFSFGEFIFNETVSASTLYFSIQNLTNRDYIGAIFFGAIGFGELAMEYFDNRKSIKAARELYELHKNGEYEFRN